MDTEEGCPAGAGERALRHALGSGRLALLVRAGLEALSGFELREGGPAVPVERRQRPTLGPLPELVQPVQRVGVVRFREAVEGEVVGPAVRLVARPA